MNSYQERRSSSLDRRKRQIVQNWLSSFVVTTVVIAIIILAPPKLSATFLRVEPFGSNLFYQVQIIDEADTITPGSLKVRVENPLAQYEADLPLGISSGSFDGLRPGTSYTISIVAKRGFGEEVLSKQTIQTETGFGGRIVSSSYQEIDTGSMHEQMYLYTINTSFSDRFNEIEQIWLEYIYLYEYIEGVTEEPSVDQMIEFPIATYQQSTIIENVPGFNGLLYLRLKARLVSQEIVVLDKQIIHTPVSIESSMYVNDVGPNQISLSLYLDFEVVQDIKYTVQLVQNGAVLSEKEVKETADVNHYDGYHVIFDKLLINTYYHVALKATYTDPISLTKVTKDLGQIRLSTSGSYQLNISHTTTQNAHSIQINLTDPLGIIQNVRYILYDTSDGYEYFIESAEMILEPIENNSYQATVLVDIPLFDSYKITVFVDKHIQVDQIYYYVPVYEIIIE